ncbi:MAG: hypothetical protein KC582_04845, partial [Candidatus Magasanikbacteria bacterium]|nr:hypothetical protein [Candidatus Magasanikbacteria bacterium]
DWFFRLEKCGFNEGRMECLTRTSVEHLIFNAERRKLFLGHLDIVLRYYFGHDKSFRYTQNRVFI